MQKQHRLARPAAHALLALCAAALIGPACAAPDTLAPQYAAAIASSARSDDDRKADARRNPGAFLEFAKLAPGMKVLDVAAGGGATAALLAAAVGSGGTVWAQNGKPAPKLEQRLAAGAQPQLLALVAPYDNPVPPGAPALDLVTINMSYHDIVNTTTDRAAMNQHLYAALKPGGHVVIIDNAAKDGSGLSATKTLHRIDEAAVIAELRAAGFVLDAKGDYLRVPSDPRELPFFKMDGQPDDKFALRFVKR